MSSTYKRSSNAEFNVFLQKIAAANIRHAEAEQAHEEFPWCRSCLSYHMRSNPTCYFKVRPFRAIYNIIRSFRRKT